MALGVRQRREHEPIFHSMACFKNQGLIEARCGRFVSQGHFCSLHAKDSPCSPLFGSVALFEYVRPLFFGDIDHKVWALSWAK